MSKAKHKLKCDINIIFRNFHMNKILEEQDFLSANCILQEMKSQTPFSEETRELCGWQESLHQELKMKYHYYNKQIRLEGVQICQLLGHKPTSKW